LNQPIRGNIARVLDDVITSQSKLQVVGAGSGGVPEMVQYMKDDEVMWALLRFEYGSGTFARTKVVFLQFNGENTPVIQRGQANSLNKTVAHFLRSEGKDHFHASLQLNDLADVTIENIMTEVAQYFVVDSIASETTSSMLMKYHEQLAKEQAEAHERVEAAKRREEEIRAKRKAQRNEYAKTVLEFGQQDPEMPKTGAVLEVPQPDAPKVRKTLRRGSVLLQLSIEGLQQVAQGGKWNWVLVGPDVAKLPLLGGGSGGVDEMRATAKENEDLVMFGLIRVQFSSPGLTQTRFCLMHIVGDRVKAVKRGKWNALRPQFEKRFGEFASLSAICADVAVPDITTKTLLDKVGYTTDYLVEGAKKDNTVSALRAYQQSLINERLNAEISQKPRPHQVLRDRIQRTSSLKEDPREEREDEPPSEAEDSEDEADDDEQHAPHFDETMQEANRLVRISREANWALVRPRRIKLSKLERARTRASAAARAGG